MRAIYGLLTGGVLLVLAGCAGLSVDTDYDPAVDFTTLKTYDWAPTQADASIDELVEKRVRNAVNTQLQAKGYVLSSDAPDFLVSMALATRTSTAGSVGIGASVGIPIGHGGTVSVGGGKSKPREKTEGTLILDFVNPTSRSLMWKGTAEAGVNGASSPEQQQSRINRVVSELLAEFPPKK
ncbi:MAG: DUF4136 domain-containing protein [Nitrospirota bacterium]